MRRARVVSLGGALAAALASSSCCLVPLLLAVLGRYEPAPGRLAAYVAAMDELGYEAKVMNESETPR